MKFLLWLTLILADFFLFGLQIRWSFEVFVLLVNKTVLLVLFHKCKDMQATLRKNGLALALVVLFFLNTCSS